MKREVDQEIGVDTLCWQEGAEIHLAARAQAANGQIDVAAAPLTDGFGDLVEVLTGPRRDFLENFRLPRLRRHVAERNQDPVEQALILHLRRDLDRKLLPLIVARGLPARPLSHYGKKDTLSLRFLLIRSGRGPSPGVALQVGKPPFLERGYRLEYADGFCQLIRVECRNDSGTYVGMRSSCRFTAPSLIVVPPRSSCRRREPIHSERRRFYHWLDHYNARVHPRTRLRRSV
jgi:hypothetical protein